MGPPEPLWVRTPTRGRCSKGRSGRGGGGSSRRAACRPPRDRRPQPCKLNTTTPANPRRQAVGGWWSPPPPQPHPVGGGGPNSQPHPHPPASIFGSTNCMSKIAFGAWVRVEPPHLGTCVLPHHRGPPITVPRSRVKSSTGHLNGKVLGTETTRRGCMKYGTWPALSSYKSRQISAIPASSNKSQQIPESPSKSQQHHQDLNHENTPQI